MTPPECERARLALLAGETSSEHSAQCATCAAFAVQLALADRQLEHAAQEAHDGELPPLLRQRILDAARHAQHGPARARRPRLQLFEGGVRFAAVAAVLWMVLAALPETVWAGEVDLSGLEGLGGRLRAAVQGSIDAPTALTLPAFENSIPGLELAQPGLMAVVAIGLVVGGLALVRRGGPR